MKILYVVSRPLEINTSSSIRNRATIMGLAENGHEVDLITTVPDSNHFAYDDSMTIEGVKVTYIRLEGIQSVARLGRKMKFLDPLKKAVVKYMDSNDIYDNLKGIVDHVSEVDCRKYDLIISSSDPKSSHLFVDRMLEQKEFSAKWIQIWGDPFLSDITLSQGKNREEVFNEERRLISKCDKVVYVSGLTLESQQEIYSEFADKMVHIPVPYLDEIIGGESDFSNKKCIRLAYCGDYTSNVRNIIPLYDALKILEDRCEIRICGNSDLNIDSYNNITITGREPYEEVEKIERNADILVHISNLSGSQIPGKIYQYSGTDKPILFILDGDKLAIREQFEIYNRYCFADNDKESIINAIDGIITDSREYKPLQEFSRKAIANRITSIIKNNS